MSFSQIKQIAGRAGRFGQHDAGSEGGVTTLNEQDLPLLRQILPSPLTPVPRAAIEPGYDRLAQLALLLPEETPYANLLETYENLVHLSPACMPSATVVRMPSAPPSQQWLLASTATSTPASRRASANATGDRNSG